jgi:hypothetical protein
MRAAYRVLAYLVALEVVVQAATIAYAIFGLGKYIDEGGVVDKAAQESGPGFPEVIGFIIHGINGQFGVPLFALLLLIVSFFAKVPKGVQFAVTVVVLVALQVTLGIFGHGITGLGILHGINALVLFTVAVMAARLATTTADARTSVPAGMA